MDITHHLDRLKESFLWAASKGGRSQECQSLLTMGADVNWVNKGEGSTTPILEAARNGHREVFMLLLAHGADTGVKTEMGENLLHLAAGRNDGDMCASLSGAKCSVMERNNRDETPIDVAVGKGYGALAKRLERMLVGGMAGTDRRDSFNSGAEERVNLPNIVSRQGHEREEEEGGAASEEEEGESDEDDQSEESLSDGQLSPSRLPHNSLADPKMPHALTVDAWHKAQAEAGGGKVEKPRKLDQSTLVVEEGGKGVEGVQLISDLNTLTLPQQVKHLEGRLEKAIHDRDKSANQAKAIKKQSSKLTSDLMSADATVNRIRAERNELRKVVSELRGRVEGLTLEDIERVEMELSAALKNVLKVKERKVKEALVTEEEKRMCVVCQTSAKTVLLMPCRHMCLCKECSRNNAMDKCPLCRVKVTQKIDVFA